MYKHSKRPHYSGEYPGIFDDILDEFKEQGRTSLIDALDENKTDCSTFTDSQIQMRIQNRCLLRLAGPLPCGLLAGAKAVIEDPRVR